MLQREVGRVRRYGGCCSLVVFDLDHFKDFNDRYGHAAGNVLLAKVGAAIRHEQRESDISARFGGEELVVLVPGSSRQAVALAERVRQSIEVLMVSPGPGAARSARRCPPASRSTRPTPAPRTSCSPRPTRPSTRQSAAAATRSW